MLVRAVRVSLACQAVRASASPSGQKLPLRSSTRSRTSSQRSVVSTQTKSRKKFAQPDISRSHHRAMAGAAAATEPLWDNVLRAYDRGQTSGAAVSLKSEPKLIYDPSCDYEFVVRLSEALQKKPTLQDVKKSEQKTASNGEKRPAFNPFLPYDENLYVRHLPPKHVLLLNKFNVVANHMLVVTQEFEHQDDPINEADFAATLEVLRAMPGDGGLAFYNCGEASGHSQPHKHIQIVPLPLSELKAGPPPAEPAVLAAAAQAGAAPGEPFQAAKLPFRAHCAVLRDGAGAKEVAEAYNKLMALTAKEATSYNLLLTTKWMMAVPRRQERLGNVAVNALGFVGTILVRSKADLEELERVGPGAVLAATGVATGAPAPPAAAGEKR